VKPAKHLYQADPELPADHRGQQRCRCGRPKNNAVHELPDVPAEVTAQERRRTGERDD
jgi:hypothetical protein